MIASMQLWLKNIPEEFLEDDEENPGDLKGNLSNSTIPTQVLNTMQLSEGTGEQNQESKKNTPGFMEDWSEARNHELEQNTQDISEDWSEARNHELEKKTQEISEDWSDAINQQLEQNAPGKSEDWSETMNRKQHTLFKDDYSDFQDQEDAPGSMEDPENLLDQELEQSLTDLNNSVSSIKKLKPSPEQKNRVEDSENLPQTIDYDVYKERVDGRTRYSCNKCKFRCFDRTGFKRHFQSMHTGTRYSCDQCDKVYTWKPRLIQHKRSVHENIRYTCDICGKVCKSVAILNTHKRIAHEGMRYKCDQCDYECKFASLLWRHVKSKHEGIVYPCDACNKAYKTTSHLRKHKMRMHEDGATMNHCSQCTFSSIYPESLNRHRKRKH